MQNLNQVLSLEDNQAIILAVGAIITPKIKERDQFNHLNKAEKTFIYLDIFEAALHTGNLESFFRNSGQFAASIIEAYRDIKASKTVELLEKAISYYPNKTISNNFDKRQQEIDTLSYETLENWDRIFEEFFEISEPVADLLADYIRAHKHQFTVESNTGTNV